MEPDKFWSLTWPELEDILAGYVFKQERRIEELNYLAWLTAMFERQKRLPKLEKILGRKNTEQKKMSEEDRKKELARLKEKFK